MNKTMISRYMLILLSMLLGGLSFAADSPPTFQRLSVTERFSGSPAPVDISNNPKARRFRTVLKDGAKFGPNFAGHYTIVIWGCGTACQEFAIVDAKNGRVYFPSSIRLNAYQMVHDETEPFQYKKDSRLLIIAGAPDDDEELGLFYYKWDGKDLKLISKDVRTFEPKE